jgi:hypothetical protein
MRLSYPLPPICHPHLHVVYPVLTNEVLTTEPQWYNCSINTEETLYQMICPEALKGASPTTGLLLSRPATGWKEDGCLLECCAV